MSTDDTKAKYRIAWCIIILSNMLVLSGHLRSQSQPPENAKPQIVVRISANHQRFYPGEDVRLRVEIWNQSERDLFVFKDIDTIDNALAKIDLVLYYKGHSIGPKTMLVADCFCSERASYPPLSEELPRHWIALAPHHFYGGEVILSLAQFKKPQVPGRYLIKGRYSSRGFLAEDMNNPLLHYAKELKQLPYEAWVGEVETNPLWIEIRK
jgi:hypothetical protein